VRRAHRPRARWRVAAVQTTSTDDLTANLTRAERAIARAAGEGADLVALPEHFASLRREGEPVPAAEPLDGAIVGRMQEAASRASVFVLLGSFPEAIPGRRKIHNTSVLLGPRGTIEAVYRKIHLFDVKIPGKVDLRESRVVEPGTETVVAKTPLGALGLSICYDLRFPELYRRLALAGAEVLFVPSAFTAYTGRFHWTALLRARAIENQCFVVAPAQTGVHHPGRASYGHAAVVDPWGTVLRQLGTRPGIAYADVDLERLRRVRNDMPALRHVRVV
jgi:predicted amidohydrolase